MKQNCPCQKIGRDFLFDGIISRMETLALNAQKLFGVTLSAAQLKQLSSYESLLLEWNEKINLTAIRDVPGIRSKHFLDSLSCVLAFKSGEAPRSLIDVGTGAGFPGIVLKILYPSMKLTLVESVGKKAKFCADVVDKLGLANVQILSARAEDVGRMKDQREQYDWAVARAVAQMPVLAEYLLPLVKVGGCVLAQKGETGPAEVNQSAQAFKILGGRFRQVVNVQLPGVADERFLVIIDKIALTPATYPRQAGTPTKKPL